MRTPSRRSDPARTAVVSAFFLAGIVTVLLGPILPELRADWGGGEAELAPLFVAQFTASSIGAVLSGFYLRGSIVAGYWLVGAGLGVLAAGGRPLALFAMALLGLGLGLALAASNLFVAHRESAHRGGALATLNVVWGLGAMSSSLLVAGARGFLSLPAILGCLAVASTLAGLGLWRLVPEDSATTVTTSGSDREPKAEAGWTFLVSTAAMLFLYVGAENAVGGWLVTLSNQLADDRSSVSLFIGSGFWAAILAGRAATHWMLLRISESTLYQLSLIVALVGTAVLWLADARPLVAAAAVLVGVGLAPLFPLTVSLLAAATAASRSRTAGWVLACGGLGGAALPWLTGRLGGAGAVQRGFLVPLAGLLVLATLYGFRRVWSDPQSAN